MVKIVIKKGDEAQFLCETTVVTMVEELVKEIIPIYNGRLKVHRICDEIKELSEHGTTLAPNMQGLGEEQIDELKLKDEWGDKCIPSGGFDVCQDKCGRRNGKAPNSKMAEVLTKTAKEAKDMISKKLVASNQLLTFAEVHQALDILRGAVMIVYPMGLPPHDPIRMELENQEDLEGQQASMEVMEEANSALWFAGKELLRGKKLCDFMGKNEKTKVICKLQKKGSGAPAREPVVDEDQQKAMMSYAYKKQEEFKKLNEAAAEDNTSYDATWADNTGLKCQMQGVSNIHWRPGKF